VQAVLDRAGRDAQDFDEADIQAEIDDYVSMQEAVAVGAGDVGLTSASNDAIVAMTSVGPVPTEMPPLPHDSDDEDAVATGESSAVAALDSVGPVPTDVPPLPDDMEFEKMQNANIAVRKTKRVAAFA
jgi:hypothetical protein